MLANKRAHESAAPSVRLPIYAESRSAIGIRQGHRRHRVSQLDERRIESYFVAANVIFIIDWAGLHRRELTRAQERHSVMLRIHRELHGRWDDLICVTQKFTSHLVREGNQCHSLLLSCLIIDEQDRLRRVGVCVGIAQGRVSMDSSGYG